MLCTCRYCLVVYSNLSYLASGCYYVCVYALGRSQVTGDFFNASLSCLQMVQDYLANAVSDRASCPLGQTVGAILMSEADGRTASLLTVFASSSRMCAPPGAGAVNKTGARDATCVLAHVFEAQYDVSGIDFSVINDFYEPSYGRRRRLLQLEGRRSRWKLSPTAGVSGTKQRRKLGTSSSASSSSHSGPVQALTCRTLVPRPPSCKPGTGAFPRCTVICLPTSGVPKRMTRGEWVLSTMRVVLRFHPQLTGLLDNAMRLRLGLRSGRCCSVGKKGSDAIHGSNNGTWMRLPTRCCCARVAAN